MRLSLARACTLLRPRDSGGGGTARSAVEGAPPSPLLRRHLHDRVCQIVDVTWQVAHRNPYNFDAVRFKPSSRQITESLSSGLTRVDARRATDIERTGRRMRRRKRLPGPRPSKRSPRLSRRAPRRRLCAAPTTFDGALMSRASRPLHRLGGPLRCRGGGSSAVYTHSPADYAVFRTRELSCLVKRKR